MMIWHLSSMPVMGGLAVTSGVEGPIAGGPNVHPSLIKVHNHAGWDVVLLHNVLDGLEVHVGIFHGAQHLWRGDVSAILGALSLGPSHAAQKRLCPGLGKVDMAPMLCQVSRLEVSHNAN